jgi:hypothetical protein
MYEAIAARDTGIRQVLEHTDRVVPKWTDQALELFRQFLTVRHRPFLAEDFREWVGDRLPAPPHVNAWGALVKRAQARGLILFHGYGPTIHKAGHGRVAAMWVRLHPT